MNLFTWLLGGFAVFLFYCAYKGLNPLNAIASRFGVATTAPAKVGNRT